MNEIIEPEEVKEVVLPSTGDSRVEVLPSPFLYGQTACSPAQFSTKTWGWPQAEASHAVAQTSKGAHLFAF